MNRCNYNNTSQALFKFYHYSQYQNAIVIFLIWQSYRPCAMVSLCFYPFLVIQLDSTLAK